MTMTTDELIQWAEEHGWPILPEKTLREMEAEGITFEIRDGAPFFNMDNWIGYPTPR